MSPVSAYRCRAIRAASQWDPALSLQQSRLSAYDFPPPVPRQRASASGETANRRHDAQWQWRAGYRPGPAGQFGHGYRRAQKKAPAVKQVNARLLRTLDPPPVNVILRQVEQAEMDEMWRFLGGK